MDSYETLWKLIDRPQDSIGKICIATGTDGVTSVGWLTDFHYPEDSTILCLEEIGTVAEEIAKIGPCRIPCGETPLQLRDVLDIIYKNTRFTHPFVVRGQPVESPWHLAFVTTTQFAERLSAQ